MEVYAPPLRRIKLLAGITDDSQDALLMQLLEDALEWMASYAGRDEWLAAPPAALGGVQVQLALHRYNRRGIEGMSAADDGGIKRHIDSVPEDVRRALNMYRRAKAVPLNASVSG